MTMKTVILAGGLGTRLAEETAVIPKPMVEIGGRPILWHIMNIYAAHGFHEFVLALGYKGEVVKDYFRSFRERNSDLTVKLARGEVTAHDAAHPDWTVHLVDTGLGTATGGRLKRLSPWLGDDATFMMTYGDGVADVDVKRLVAFHRDARKARDADRRPPARPLRRPLARRRQGDRVHREAAARRRAGSTAASSSSSARSST